jgi:hypothetical protein
MEQDENHEKGPRWSWARNHMGNVSLSILPGAGTLNLQWATNTTGFKLSQTTSLQPAIWIDVTPSPAIVGNNYSVTLPLDLTTNRFFRLHNP